jgi:hypothetical protein
MLLREHREKRDKSKMRHEKLLGGGGAGGGGGGACCDPLCGVWVCVTLLCTLLLGVGHRKRFWELGGSKMGDAMGIKAPVEEEDEKVAKAMQVATLCLASLPCCVTGPGPWDPAVLLAVVAVGGAAAGPCCAVVVSGAMVCPCPCAVCR